MIELISHPVFHFMNSHSGEQVLWLRRKWVSSEGVVRIPVSSFDHVARPKNLEGTNVYRCLSSYRCSTVETWGASPFLSKFEHRASYFDTSIVTVRRYQSHTKRLPAGRQGIRNRYPYRRTKQFSLFESDEPVSWTSTVRPFPQRDCVVIVGAWFIKPNNRVQ